MAPVTRKTEIGPVDGTPVKRMFWSIISDYDLKTGLCELIDNAIDLWMNGARQKPLEVSVTLDVSQQRISVVDNAGGVKKAELHLLISPGGSRNDPTAEVIGIFGVGSKRAGIALGERVDITTRYKKETTHLLEINAQWLESNDWEMAAYAIPDIDPRTTRVDISHLRTPLTEESEAEILRHLGETYSWFLQQGCSISVNGKGAVPLSFESWAYPSGFAPKVSSLNIDLGSGQKLTATITAGLIHDRVPEADNYGVYFYCNHRLIVKELRTREVGYFVTSEAGVPHPDASLCRAIVKLQGPARLMPWNSSKNGINFNHLAYAKLRPTLIPLVSHFSSLSRRLKDDWERKVFSRASGKVEDIDPIDPKNNKKLVLPPLPRVNKAVTEQLKSKNKKTLEIAPWTLGIVEAMGAVNIIGRQKLETRNRIALLLLDSNFEIALKEFVVHRTDLFPPSTFTDQHIQRLFQRRPDVIAAVTAKVTIPADLLAKARHYYGLRNKLVHERATVDVVDSDVNNYQRTIERILKILFGLRF